MSAGVDSAAAANVERVLAGVELPAETTELLEHAVRQHAEPALIGALRALPQRTFASLDEVAAALRESRS